MNKPDIARSQMTFSQAEGIDSLPGPLELKELPIEARNLLWSHIYEKLKAVSYRPESYGDVVGAWRKILHDFHVYFLCAPADEFDDGFVHQTGELKRFFQKAPYNRIFDFLQFILRHNSVPNEFYDVVQSILKVVNVHIWL